MLSLGVTLATMLSLATGSLLAPIGSAGASAPVQFLPQFQFSAEYYLRGTTSSLHSSGSARSYPLCSKMFHGYQQSCKETFPAEYRRARSASENRMETVTEWVTRVERQISEKTEHAIQALAPVEPEHADRTGLLHDSGLVATTAAVDAFRAARESLQSALDRIGVCATQRSEYEEHCRNHVTFRNNKKDHSLIFEGDPGHAYVAGLQRSIWLPAIERARQALDDAWDVIRGAGETPAERRARVQMALEKSVMAERETQKKERERREKEDAENRAQEGAPQDEQSSASTRTSSSDEEKKLDGKKKKDLLARSAAAADQQEEEDLLDRESSILGASEQRRKELLKSWTHNWLFAFYLFEVAFAHDADLSEFREKPAADGFSYYLENRSDFLEISPELRQGDAMPAQILWRMQMGDQNHIKHRSRTALKNKRFDLFDVGPKFLNWLVAVRDLLKLSVITVQNITDFFKVLLSPEDILHSARLVELEGIFTHHIQTKDGHKKPLLLDLHAFFHPNAKAPPGLQQLYLNFFKLPLYSNALQQQIEKDFTIPKIQGTYKNWARDFEQRTREEDPARQFTAQNTAVYKEDTMGLGALVRFGDYEEIVRARTTSRGGGAGGRNTKKPSDCDNIMRKETAFVTIGSNPEFAVFVNSSAELLLSSFLKSEENANRVFAVRHDIGGWKMSVWRDGEDWRMTSNKSTPQSLLGNLYHAAAANWNAFPYLSYSQDVVLLNIKTVPELSQRVRAANKAITAGAPRGAAIRNPLVSPPPGAGGRPSPPEEVEEWLHLIESALKKISSQYGAGMLDSAGDGSVLWAVTEVDGMRKGRYHFLDSATVLA